MQTSHLLCSIGWWMVKAVALDERRCRGGRVTIYGLLFKFGKDPGSRFYSPSP